MIVKHQRHAMHPNAIPQDKYVLALEQDSETSLS